MLDVPLERRLFGGLTNPNHWRGSGGVTPKFRGRTLTIGTCLRLRDSQLVAFCPVGDFVFSWWSRDLECLTLDLGRLFGPREPVGGPPRHSQLAVFWLLVDLGH